MSSSNDKGAPQGGARPSRGTIKAVRGTRDLLPDQTPLWNRVESTARAVFARYGFGEIRTPVIEATELFARGVGEETDIVSKEMFTWEDRARAASEKAQSLTLRPESTAGVVRAYIEHKMGETGALQKLYYIGPQFRRERPQRGRYRQFWQIGAEVIGPPSSGSESPLRDAEVIEMLDSLLAELGVRGYRLELNSVGNAEDRARYDTALREALAPVKDRLCADNQRRAETNPLRVLDSKDEQDQEIINALPKIADFLGEESREHFRQVLAALDACGVPYHVNPRLVRGLDYYTRTTFEFTVQTGLGTQNALLGGGRYDGLSEMLGGPKAPGIGFAIGEDRLILVLQEQAKQDAEAAGSTPSEAKLDVYVAPMGVEQNAAALAMARELRREGLSVELGDGTVKPGKSKEVGESKARRIVFIGALESEAGLFAAHDFETEQVRLLPRLEVAKALNQRKWAVSDASAASNNPQKQTLAIRLNLLILLNELEKPLDIEGLRVFTAIAMQIPPRKLLMESVELALSDLKSEGFVEPIDTRWIITEAGRRHIHDELRAEQSEEI